MAPSPWRNCLPPLKIILQDEEPLRLRLWNRTPFYGNDDDRADDIMKSVYSSLFDSIDGKPNTKGTVYHLNMLSTTCHVYFGKMLGASANGRFAICLNPTEHHLPMAPIAMDRRR